MEINNDDEKVLNSKNNMPELDAQGQDELRERYDEDYSISSFDTSMFNSGIGKDLNIEQIQTYLKDPIKYKKELSEISKWFYVSNGDVFQLYDLARNLCRLNYSLNCYDKDVKVVQTYKNLNKNLRRINHREITRDIISQTIINGTTVGIWLGKKDNLYPYFFDDLENFFPAYRKNNKWVVWMDLSYLDNLTEVKRQIFFEEFKGVIDESDYQLYKSDSSKYKYLELPVENTFCIRTHVFGHNQRFGIPWSTQSTTDNMHKKKLKDLEKSVANKIINSTAILTIGSDKFPEDRNINLPRTVKTKTFRGVKKALTDSESNTVSVISLPEFAKIDFRDENANKLESDKFESIDKDLQLALGYNNGLITGNGTFAANNLSLEILYSKIFELLEMIETEVFDKFLNLYTGTKKDNGNYYFEYVKEIPLKTSERMDALYKLQAQGFSIKPIIEAANLDYANYIDDSVYEIEKMKLRDKIYPSATMYTTSSKDLQENKNKDKESDTETLDKENENNEKALENDANNQPKANK